MSKSQKSLIALLGVLLIFFGFVITRIGISKPASTVTLTKIPAGEYDPAVWGKVYPLQYESYQKNQEMLPSPTGYGGSVNVQKYDMMPENKMNFKGMPFSIDYTEDRGHVFAMDDVRETKRIGPKSPGACITCKTPYVDKFHKESGWAFAKKPFIEVAKQIPDHGAISCASCHDPETMNLRVTNPAFTEALQRLGIDVAKASREDMRSYVCGQCHSEYYFAPGTMQVVFPWDKGLRPDQMYEYYAGTPNGFTQDFQHPDSKAAMLKAQHPDYEAWANGTHGKAGVSCADCHMPYMRKDGQKFSSHQMTSPLKNLDASCGACHTQGADWLLAKVKTTQDYTFQVMQMAGQNVARAHEIIGKANQVAGADQAELAKARELVRKAQWYWDFTAAENSMGFHNPDQTLNTLAQSNELARQAIETANRAAGVNML